MADRLHVTSSAGCCFTGALFTSRSVQTSTAIVASQRTVHLATKIRPSGILDTDTLLWDSLPAYPGMAAEAIMSSEMNSVVDIYRIPRGLPMQNKPGDRGSLSAY